MRTLNDLVFELIIAGQTDRQITRFVSSKLGIKPAVTKMLIRDIYARVLPAAATALAAKGLV